MSNQSNAEDHGAPIPPDDLSRALVLAQGDRTLPHIGLVGDTYAILLAGKDTGGGSR